jgi:hypothetical protein
MISFTVAILSFIRRGTRKRWFARWIRTVIFMHGLVLVLAFGVGIFGGGFWQTKVVGFWFKMNWLADVSAIRSWSANYTPSPHERTAVGYEDLEVPRDEWPVCISRLRPKGVSYNAQQKIVHLVFSGGFGQLELSVGPKGTMSSYRGSLLRSGAWVSAKEEE